MSGNSIGVLFRVTTWGESHGKALGAVVDGCPPHIDLTESDIQAELARRRPGQYTSTSPRKVRGVWHSPQWVNARVKYAPRFHSADCAGSGSNVLGSKYSHFHTDKFKRQENGNDKSCALLARLTGGNAYK